MSGSDWLPSPPVGVGLILIATLVALILTNQYDKAECGHAGSAQQHEDARCADDPFSSGNGMTKPAYGDPQPDWNIYKEYEDLNAQRSMAHWAFAMVVVSAISALITLAGVIYVAMTLQETRAGVKEAEKATAATQAALNLAKAEKRPFLQIRPRFSVGLVQQGWLAEARNNGEVIPLRYIRYEYETEIENFGPIPCEIMSIDCVVSQCGFERNADEFVSWIKENCQITSGFNLIHDNRERRDIPGKVIAFKEIFHGDIVATKSMPWPRGFAQKLVGVQDRNENYFLLTVTVISQDFLGMKRTLREEWRFDHLAPIRISRHEHEEPAN